MVNKVFLYNVSVKKKSVLEVPNLYEKQRKIGLWLTIISYTIKKTELFLMLNAMTGQLLYISGFQGNFS